MCGTITLDEELIDVIISALKEKKSRLLYEKDYRRCLEALVKVQEVKDAIIVQREMS